jgi:hypothetical protein
VNTTEQTRKFTAEEIEAIKASMIEARIIEGTTEELPLQFNSLDIQMRHYFFAQVYGQCCAAAYAHHLTTGQQIEYREIANMALHMTNAGLREVGNEPTE